MVESSLKSLLGGDDAQDCKFSPRLFDECLLEIPEPICERIFVQTKHLIVIVLASGITVRLGTVSVGAIGFMCIRNK